MRSEAGCRGNNDRSDRIVLDSVADERDAIAN